MMNNAEWVTILLYLVLRYNSIVAFSLLCLAVVTSWPDLHFVFFYGFVE